MAINVGSAFAYGFLTTLGTNGGLGISKDACVKEFSFVPLGFVPLGLGP